MAAAGKGTDHGVIKAWAAIDDILDEEAGTFAERLDVEAILEAAHGFLREEYQWLFMWRQVEHSLVFTIHKNQQIVPIKDARWLARKVKELGLLPDPAEEL